MSDDVDDYKQKKQANVEILKKATKAEAVAELWRRGILLWKLDTCQKGVYDAVLKNEELVQVISISRQTGKSFLMCVMAIEHCLKNPNATVKYGAPTAKMARKLVKSNFREIFKDCPNDIKPKFNSILNVYTFKNGSELSIESLDAANVDDIRGTPSQLSIIDEAAFIDDFEYALNSVIRPMHNTTGGKILIVSTPPTKVGHYFEIAVDNAKKTNSYIKKTIYDWFEETKDDHPVFRDRIKRKIIEDTKRDYGGETSIKWRVEYLCEIIRDYEDKIVPEWVDDLEKEIVVDEPRPDKFDTYVALDIGYNDYTAGLFAHYDFRNNQVVIEDEYWIQGRKANSAIIASDIKVIEQKLWHDKNNNPIQPYLRVADDDMMVLNDLNNLHGIVFMPTKKDNRDASINELRIKVATKKIKINPKCTNLIHQLRMGRWNKQRTSFARVADCGHFDLIDALIYLIRNIQYFKNPYDEAISYRHHDKYYPDMTKPVSSEAKPWGSVIKPWTRLKAK